MQRTLLLLTLRAFFRACGNTLAFVLVAITSMPMLVLIAAHSGNVPLAERIGALFFNIVFALHNYLMQ